MPAPWFTENDAADGAASVDYATSIANIVADLEAHVGVDKDGRVTFDVEAAVQTATDRVGTYQAYMGTFTNVQMFLATPFRSIFERLAANLAKTESGAVDGVGVGPDLTPLLADCETKSKAVTDYFDRLYDEVLPQLLDESLESGALTKNVPPVDDLTKETRFYVVTWVNDWENESKPSAVSAMMEVGTKDTVTVERPADPGNANLAYWRAYRSNSGSQGAQFQYVPNPNDELGWPIATASFTDDTPNSLLQETCPSTIWDAPDAALSGIVAQDNGIHVGFLNGRTLCPSENFIPFAFPRDYQRTIPEEIVALLGMEGMTFVATRGRPHFLIGNDAANMRVVDGKSSQACVSARSICATPMGPVYASPDGLCLAVPDAPVQVLTEGLFTKEEWNALGPEDMVVQYHDGVIHMMRDNAGPAQYPLNATYLWHTISTSGDVTLLGGNQLWNYNVSQFGAGNNRMGRTNTPLSGKVYCEMTPTARNGAMPMAFGITQATLAAFYSAGSYNMFSGNGLCGLPAAGLGADGVETSNDTYAFSENDVIGIAVDAAAGKLWFSRNGTWLQGNPATGASPSHTFTPGTWYFYVATYSCNTSAGTATVSIEPINTVYAPPTGFTTYQPE